MTTHTQSTGILVLASFLSHNFLGSNARPYPHSPKKVMPATSHNWLQCHWKSQLLPSIWNVEVKMYALIKTDLYLNLWLKKGAGFQILNKKYVTAFTLTSCRYKHPSTKYHEDDSYSCNMIPKLFYNSTEIMKQIENI